MKNQEPKPGVCERTGRRSRENVNVGSRMPKWRDDFSQRPTSTETDSGPSLMCPDRRFRAGLVKFARVKRPGDDS